LQKQSHRAPAVSRRLLFGIISAAALRADERTDILEIIEPLAAALSESRGEDFMAPFAEDMPSRAELRSHIAALIAFAEVTSSVELGRVRDGRAELDWYMEIRARATGSVVERRREKVLIRVSDRRIRELSPVGFFRVPVLR
jgi:hypothetical protein